MSIIKSPYMTKQREIKKQLEDAFKEGQRDGWGAGFEKAMNFTLDYLVQKVVPLHGEKPIKEVESLIKSMLEEEMKKQEEEKKK